jgi:hypothetical protein
MKSIVNHKKFIKGEFDMIRETLLEEKAVD